jgi:hypothetical protein
MDIVGIIVVGEKVKSTGSMYGVAPGRLRGCASAGEETTIHDIRHQSG